MNILRKAAAAALVFSLASGPVWAGGPKIFSSALKGPPEKEFGSIVVARWAEPDGSVRTIAKVAIGHPTKDAADKAAIDACKKEGGGDNCLVRRNWGRGCGYVATGSNGQTTFAAWSTSPEETMGECKKTSAKAVCGEPIGGCND